MKILRKYVMPDVKPMWSIIDTGNNNDETVIVYYDTILIARQIASLA